MNHKYNNTVQWKTRKFPLSLTEWEKHIYLFGDFNICSKYESTDTDVQKQNFTSIFYHTVMANL